MLRMDQLFSNLVRGIKALQIIYENTTTDDLCLRLYISPWCIDHREVISSSPDLLSLIRMHEATAWAIASEIQPQLESQAETIRTMEMQIKKQEESLYDRLKVKKSELRALVDLLQSTDHCDSFDSRCRENDSPSFKFETATSSGRQYHLVCRTCNKKHSSWMWFPTYGD
jgi:hypothetical protein